MTLAARLHTLARWLISHALLTPARPGQQDAVSRTLRVAA